MSDASRWARTCRCGHQQAQHRGAKRTGGCFGWSPEAMKRCDCKGFKSSTARRRKQKVDDRPLAPVINIATKRRMQGRTA